MDTAKVARSAGYDFSAPFLLAPGGTRIIQIQPPCAAICVVLTAIRKADQIDLKRSLSKVWKVFYRRQSQLATSMLAFPEASHFSGKDWKIYLVSQRGLAFQLL